MLQVATTAVRIRTTTVTTKRKPMPASRATNLASEWTYTISGVPTTGAAVLPLGSCSPASILGKRKVVEDEDPGVTSSALTTKDTWGFHQQPATSSHCLLYSILNLIGEEEGVRKFDLARCVTYIESLPSNQTAGNSDLQMGVLLSHVRSYFSLLKEDNVLSSWKIERLKTKSGPQGRLYRLFMAVRHFKVITRFLLVGLSSPSDVKKGRISVLKKWYGKAEVRDPLGWLASHMDLPSETYDNMGYLRAVRCAQEQAQEEHMEATLKGKTLPKKPVKTFAQLQVTRGGNLKGNLHAAALIWLPEDKVFLLLDPGRKKPFSLSGFNCTWKDCEVFLTSFTVVYSINQVELNWSV